MVLCCLGMLGCATYYQKQADLQRKFVSGDMEGALAYLESNEKKLGKPHVRVLYMLNRGLIASLAGHYELSNEYFNTADRLIGERINSGAWEALALVTNPMVKPYQVEDFENVMLNYYTSNNYLDMGKLEAALVEARRINIKLNDLADKAKRKTTYTKDAFAHYLMGMIYEASYDDNNAFIAYRNAYEAYRDVYAKNYGLQVPQQLKQDLMRSAHFNKFVEERKQYEKEFSTTYQHNYDKQDGEVVFFWENGLGPVKDENRISFTIVPGVGGAITFQNTEEGFVFPFPAASVSADERKSLLDLRVIRMVLPRYLERPSVFKRSTLKVNGKEHKMDMVEPINAIALQSLKDRLAREVATAILRVALKQAAAEIARAKEKDGLGLALDLFGAISEQADTRNWQTLPHDIHIGRMRLPAGKHTIQLVTYGQGNQARTHDFEVNIESGKTKFMRFRSLEATRTFID